MRTNSLNATRRPAIARLFLSAALPLALAFPAAAQQQDEPPVAPAGEAVAAEPATDAAPAQSAAGQPITVTGAPPADLSGLEKGPDVVGMISARRGDRMQVTGDDRQSMVVAISEGTEVRGRGGFLGLSRTALTPAALMNGLPVTVETVQWGGELVASRVRLRNDDLQTASMIRTGTAQGFAEQSAATDALRSRVANIDQYDVVRTTNVFFDTDRWQLNPQAEAELCSAASEAQATDNALLLVIGYADATGAEEYNQTLSERRAGRVVNHLQQRCRWAPYRMLTPSGMAEADPLADNATDEGRAQNRRVQVSILRSKAVAGL